jgi:hypothetical protein
VVAVRSRASKTAAFAATLDALQMRAASEEIIVATTNPDRDGRNSAFCFITFIVCYEIYCALVAVDLKEGRDTFGATHDGLRVPVQPPAAAVCTEEQDTVSNDEGLARVTPAFV